MQLNYIYIFKMSKFQRYSDIFSISGHFKHFSCVGAKRTNFRVIINEL